MEGMEMQIGNIAEGSPNFSMPKNTDVDSKIKALEQKIQQLSMDKQKAKQKKDVETERKIEKQIQQIQQRIEQLRRQSAKEDDITKPANSAEKNNNKPSEPNQIDKYA